MESFCRKIPPCKEACPAGVDVPRYLRKIRAGDFPAALAIIREKIPFPAVCGYACVHPCEAACARRQLDEAVAIRALKRFVAEEGCQLAPRPEPAADTTKRVAVVGAGPCGLTAAYYLALAGHKVTVFEALPEAGGMLRYGIPEYRLPRKVLEQEINDIMSAGLNVQVNTKVSSPEDLLRSGFHAVLLACGAWRRAKLGIEGEELAGVLDGLSFLQACNTGQPQPVGKRVAVIGGGNTALDAARSSVRLGAKEVTVYYRRTRVEMPASDEEIEGALAEGVNIEFLALPLRVTAKEKGYTVVFHRVQLGPKDAKGRPLPIPLQGSEYSQQADTIIIAIGQLPNLQSRQTDKKGIFYGGDMVNGPTSIIQAIAEGRKTASAIDQFLGGSGDLDRSLAGEQERETPGDPLLRGCPRPYLPTLPLQDRLKSFAGVELGYDQRAAGTEAGRCLGCDLNYYLVELDQKACKDCGYCTEVCQLGVFAPADCFNDRGYLPMQAAHLEKCIGCRDCFWVCPDFAINVLARKEVIA